MPAMPRRGRCVPLEYPVRAGLAEAAAAYRWSSAAAHVTGEDRDGVLGMEW